MDNNTSLKEIIDYLTELFDFELKKFNNSRKKLQRMLKIRQIEELKIKIGNDLLLISTIKEIYNPKENTDLHSKNVIFRHDGIGTKNLEIYKLGLKAIYTKWRGDIVGQDVTKRLKLEQEGKQKSLDQLQKEFSREKSNKAINRIEENKEKLKELYLEFFAMFEKFKTDTKFSTIEDYESEYKQKLEEIEAEGSKNENDKSKLDVKYSEIRKNIINGTYNVSSLSPIHLYSYQSFYKPYEYKIYEYDNSSNNWTEKSDYLKAEQEPKKKLDLFYNYISELNQKLRNLKGGKRKPKKFSVKKKKKGKRSKSVRRKSKRAKNKN